LEGNGLVHTKFREKLKNYDDVMVCEFIEFGWPLGHNGTPTRCDAPKNHGGALSFPGKIGDYIVTEKNLGRIIGPFDKNPLATSLAISPLNSVEKSGSTDRRVITDLSYPEQGSVNSGIDKFEFLGLKIRTRYPTVDCVAELIVEKGQGCLLFKRDMRKAFRQIRVDPGDINLLGFRWEGKVYVDTVLAMGLRSAAYICQRLTNAIAYIHRQKGFDVVNYLDDFCGVEDAALADTAFNSLGDLLVELGVTEAASKAVSPSSRVAFLGIWFDTNKMTMEVTPERLIEIKGLTQVWLLKKSATLKEVQSIIGKVNFVAKCVKPARIFISRMLNFLRGMNKTGRSVLTEEFRGDIRWWCRYLPCFNGISLLLKEPWSKPDEVLASDACLVGCGAVCGHEFLHSAFPKVILSGEHHINILELLALVVACLAWADVLRGKRVVVWCDNIATVWVINTGKTRDSYMQALLRELCYFTAVHDCEIYARHIPGIQNRVPDMLSRWEISKSAREQFLREESLIYTREVLVREEWFITECLRW